MLKDLFRSKPRYVTVKSGQATTAGPTPKREVPDGLWTKCDKCSNILYNKELARDLFVCAKCGHHFYMPAGERLRSLIDDGSFQEWDANLRSTDPLGFPGYQAKLARSQEATGLAEAIVTGGSSLDGIAIGIGILDFGFFTGSMGSVVGEKIARLFERARDLRIPVVIVSGGGGGARMQEGILSLMQLAKTSQAVETYAQCRQPYISVLTNPTMAGVYASFASLGDYVLAEPGALIGFAGPRIVQKTIRQPLPTGFQSAEFVIKNGMLDLIVERKDLRSTLGRLLRLHRPAASNGAAKR